MPDPQFSAGDTVQLKSGGPLMTVFKALPSGTTICTWFEEITVDGNKTQVQRKVVLPQSNLKAGKEGT